jgi:ATP-dependent 26S proteasome regulatory subunit
LIEELGHFRAQGLRRNILFQGKPGTGKSTLCREAARRLSSRTLILTSEYLSNVAASEWKMLLQMLDPEMVIVDDIDRISYNLESKLSLFEEGHCDVPYILMTSNDHETLPQALRRPGRIDMIFKLDDPEPWVLDEVIRGLAEREGVEIPTEHLEHLRKIAQETSTAHVVEVFRRAKVQGWGYELNGDITYTDGFRPQKPKDHGKPYVGMPVPDWFTSGKPLAVFKEYFSEIPEEIVTEITMDWVDQLTR